MFLNKPLFFRHGSGQTKHMHAQQTVLSCKLTLIFCHGSWHTKHMHAQQTVLSRKLTLIFRHGSWHTKDMHAEAVLSCKLTPPWFVAHETHRR